MFIPIFSGFKKQKQIKNSPADSLTPHSSSKNFLLLNKINQDFYILKVYAELSRIKDENVYFLYPYHTLLKVAFPSHLNKGFHI